MWNTVDGRSSHMHSQTRSVANRQIRLKLKKKMVKTEVMWNNAEVFKKQTFLVAFPTKNAADQRIWFQCQLPLRFPKGITKFKFNRKIAQTAPCINCTFCWNRTKLPNSWERHQNPWQGRTQKPALLPSSRSLIKLAECCIQQLKVMWSPEFLTCICCWGNRWKKPSFCFPSSLSPTTFYILTKHQWLLY